MNKTLLYIDMIIIKIICLAWFLTHTSDFIEEINQVLKRKRNILKIPSKILSCLMCCSFWVTLIWTQDFLLATQISFVAYLMDKYLLTTNIKL